MSINFDNFRPREEFAEQAAVKRFTPRRARKRNLVTDSSLKIAGETPAFGGAARRVNQQRLEGAIPSLTQTKQQDEATLEHFMAAWDTQEYGQPTNGEIDDPRREQVRQDAFALLKDGQRFDPATTGMLREKLKSAKANGVTIQPGELGGFVQETPPDPEQSSAERQVRIGKQVDGGLPELLSNDDATLFQDLRDETAHRLGQFAQDWNPIGITDRVVGRDPSENPVNVNLSNVIGQMLASPLDLPAAVEFAGDEKKPGFDRSMAAAQVLLMGIGMKGTANAFLESKGIPPSAVREIVEEAEKVGTPEIKARAQEVLSEIDRSEFTAAKLAEETPMVTEPLDVPVRVKAKAGSSRRVVKEPVKSVDEPVRVDEEPVRVLEPDQRAGAGDAGKVRDGAGTPGRGSERNPGQQEPNTTSLANQFQSRESLDGILSEVEPTKGKSAQDWQAIGKQAVEGGEDPHVLAKQIRDGEVELTGERVGVLLEGKRQLLADVNSAKTRLDATPGDKKALADLETAQTRLDDYVTDVQAGKGRWSDVGRALQAGTQLDTGDYAQVIQHLRQRGVKPNAKLEGELKIATQELADARAEIDRLNANPNEFTAQQAVARVSPRTRRFDKAGAQSRISENVGKLKELRGTRGVGAGKTRGAASKITAEDVKVLSEQTRLIKEIALDYARVVGADMEEIVRRVQKLFREELDTEIDRQAIVDSISHSETRTKTPEQVNAEVVRAQARRESSAAQAKRALQEQIEAVEKAAKEPVKAFKAENRHQRRIAKRQMDYNERTDLADAIKERRGAQKGAENYTKYEQAAWEKAERTKSRQDYQEWWNLQEKQRKFNESDDLKKLKAELDEAEKGAEDYIKFEQETYDRIERLEDSEAKSALRVWWNDNIRIKELTEDLAKGDYSEKAPELVPTRPDKETVKSLRRERKLRGDVAEKEENLAGKRSFRVVKRAKAEKTVDAHIEDLEAKVALLDSRLKTKLKAQETPAWRRGIRTVADTVRGTILGSDLGVILRQGLFTTVSRPRTAGRALKAAAKNMFSETNLAKWANANETKRYSDGRLASKVRKEAGLSTTDALNSHEEMVMTRLLSKLPGKAGQIGGSLERFQTTYINNVRNELFDLAYEKGLSAADLKSRARFINSATGRSNWKDVPDALQAVMTSPRYEASRWEMIGELIRNPATIRNKGSQENLKDLATTAASVFGLFKAAEMAGYTVDIDPKSSDFLKMRLGNEVWDVSAGLAPRIRDVMRIAIGVKELVEAGKIDWSNDAPRAIGKALVRTISPVIKTTTDQALIAGQRHNQVDDPKAFFGMFEEGDSEGLWAFAPLIAQNFWETLMGTENTFADPPAALQGAAKEFLGTSVSRYPKKD